MILHGYNIKIEPKTVTIFSYVYINQIRIIFESSEDSMKFISSFVPNITNARQDYYIHSIDTVDIYNNFPRNLDQVEYKLRKLSRGTRPLAYDFNTYFKKHSKPVPEKIDDLHTFRLHFDYFVKTAKYYHITQPGGATTIIVGSNRT